MKHMPSPMESVIEGGDDPMARSWLQWIRDFWSAAGFSPSVEEHSDLTLTGPGLDLDGGVFWTTFNGNIALPEFPAGADQAGMAIIRMPNNYREGTTLKPWLEWAPLDANAGDVDWRFEYIATRVGEVFAAATTSLDETSDCPEVAGEPVRVEFDEIDEDLRKGDSVLVRLWRLGTTDTYASGAHLIACGLKYVIDGSGTEQPHP